MLSTTMHVLVLWLDSPRIESKVVAYWWWHIANPTTYKIINTLCMQTKFNRYKLCNKPCEKTELWKGLDRSASPIQSLSTKSRGYGLCWKRSLQRRDYAIGYCIACLSCFCWGLSFWILFHKSTRASTWIGLVGSQILVQWALPIIVVVCPLECVDLYWTEEYE
jgi:hypothetical protein